MQITTLRSSATATSDGTELQLNWRARGVKAGSRFRVELATKQRFKSKRGNRVCRSQRRSAKRFKARAYRLCRFYSSIVIQTSKTKSLLVKLPADTDAASLYWHVAAFKGSSRSTWSRVGVIDLPTNPLPIAPIVAAPTTNSPNTTDTTTVPTSPTTSATSNPSKNSLYSVQQLQTPDRSVVKLVSSGQTVAVFTTGSRTVLVAGDPRSIAESGTTYLTDQTWRVRLLDQPFSGEVDSDWLDTALSDQSADIIDTALQYIDGAPDLFNSETLRIAGDADYGPLSGSSRSEGSDFNDYLGVDWDYGVGNIDTAEVSELGSLDCSGFVRMVFGYRGGIPMEHTYTASGSYIPRTSDQIFHGAPGTVVASGSGIDITVLQPGDLVFFDVDPSDGGLIDHTGIFLGIDINNHYRFISSRASINGPTMSDVNAYSRLDGSGYYASGLVGIRRL